MDIRPIDLPELRIDLIDCARRLGGGGRSSVPHPLSPSPISSADDAEIQVAALADADLYFVTASMCSLARAAASGLPSFALAPDDLPSPSGLILFEQSMHVVPHGEPVSPYQVQAFGWSTYQGAGVLIDLYADRDSALKSMVNLKVMDEDTARHNRASMPRVTRMMGRTTWWPFSRNTQAQGGEHAALEFSLTILKASWLLMQQTLADVSDVPVNRARQKRVRRAGYEPKPVRVIELRRPAHSGSGDGSREFHHQWIVRGHWRQQWYPAREVHRPVWIAPHIKGPEGAPLLGGEKVYAWKR